jgi:HNH endonuclease
MVRSAREVLSETDQIVAQDRKLTLRLLVNLHEIERNKFYLELGYGSMFDYCTQHLKYPESSAARRMRAARCLADYPHLAPLLESGEVNPTTLAAVSKYIVPDNADAVIEAIKGKSTREVERFIAALQPLSTIPPDRTHFMVVPNVGCAKSTTSAGSNELSSAGQSSPDTTVVVDRQMLQFKRLVRSEFTAEEETMQKLDRIRSLASHRLAMNASLGQLIDFMADYFLKREDPIQRQKRREERVGNTKAPTAASDNARQIPAAVRDQVFARDQRCTYVGPDGKRCNSTHVLQVDHINPVARRGAAVIGNLRLLCAEHNRLEAQRLMGRSKPSSPPA